MPEGVQVQIEPEIVRVNGPRGELAERKSRDIAVEQQDGDIVVTRPTDRKEHRALHGLTRSLIANMIEGVTSGFEKRLEIQGVGYRAALKGKNIELSVGYSHPVQIEAPDGVEFEVPQPTQVIVKGSSKQAVGEIAAQIRKVRPPEPYKGKGIRYVGRVRPEEGRQARMTVATKPKQRLRRRRRVRAKVRGSAERPRLSVFRSNRGVNAQLIDDVAGRTLAAVNWTESDVKGAPVDGAGQARRRADRRARRRRPGSRTVVFDRGGYRYHGRVKALAEGAREGGLRF